MNTRKVLEGMLSLVPQKAARKTMQKLLTELCEEHNSRLSNLHALLDAADQARDHWQEAYRELQEDLDYSRARITTLENTIQQLQAELKALQPPEKQPVRFYYPNADRVAVQVEVTEHGGKKVPCIKLLREMFGGGLKEAKEATEGIPMTCSISPETKLQSIQDEFNKWRKIRNLPESANLIISTFP